MLSVVALDYPSLRNSMGDSSLYGKTTYISHTYTNLNQATSIAFTS